MLEQLRNLSATAPAYAPDKDDLVAITRAELDALLAMVAAADACEASYGPIPEQILDAEHAGRSDVFADWVNMRLARAALDQEQPS